MKDGQSAIERALELARNGQYRTIDDIRRKLASENYQLIYQHLRGASIRKQLQAAIDAAGAKPAPG